MRQVSLSTDVFARIWALRQEGEETEDAILRRVLAIQKSEKSMPENSERSGYRDLRSGVIFPEGFEIFRRYKGRDFRAQATGGGWRLKDNNQFYPSLNAVSRNVIDGNENAWMNWNYVSDDGEIRKIAELRDETTITKRKTRSEVSNKMSVQVWREDVFQALKNLGGRAHLTEIYAETRRVRTERGATIPKNFDAVVRKELEYNSSDTSSFLNRYDLFHSVSGLGAGIWALRESVF